MVVPTEELPSNSNVSLTNVFYCLLIPTLTLWYWYWRLSRKNLLELAEKLPGPKGWPIFGNTFEFIGTSHEIFETVYKHSFEFTEIVKIWIGPRLLVFLINPADVEMILSSHVHIDKAKEYRFFKPWLGDGLLISTGKKWRTQRKLIAPTFHLNVLKSFVDLFNANSRHVVEKLRRERGKTIDCHDYMSAATVEMLLETAMGVDKRTTQNGSGCDYATAVMKMCDILHLRQTKIHLMFDFLFNLTEYGRLQATLLDTIHGLTRKVIRSKRAAVARGERGSIARVPRDERPDAATVEGLSYGQSAGLKDDLDVDENDVGAKKRMAFLDLLVESSMNGAAISDDEIKEQVDTIMFEGHDTTAAASSFFLSLMGVHGDVQEKVCRELDEIFGDSDRAATFGDTLEMKYLERCLMETLRLYPPVPIIARELKENVTLPSGYTVPAGCTVIIGTFKLHRRADIYPNPDAFDPDNFLPERTANRHYYAFVPFSAGPRSCVGRKYAMLKLKILLSTILRNYRVVSDLKEEDFKLQGDIILKRSEGFQIRLEERRRTVAKAAAAS